MLLDKSIISGSVSNPAKSSDLNPISEKENEEKLPKDEIQKEAEKVSEIQEPPLIAVDHQNVAEKNEDERAKTEAPKIEQNTSSPNEPIPPTPQVASPPKPIRKSRPQGKLVSAMINAFSNRKTLPKNPPEETMEEPKPVHEIASTTVVQTQIKPEVKSEMKLEPLPEVTPEVKIMNHNENLNIEKINLPTTVPTMTSVEPIDRSKSSSFSVPKPSAQFRSVKRPVIRTKGLKTSSIEKPKSSEGPAMTYADIMAAKEARQPNTVNPSISNASTPAPSNPLQENLISSVPSGSAHQNEANANSEVETEVETYGGNENTSDDAESIPISYQEPQESFKKTRMPSSDLQTKTSKHQKTTDMPDSEESSISEVHQEELKKDLTNHSHIPSRSRKPLVKRPSISLDQIPEEKSEASVSEKKIVEKDTSKKKRRRRSKGEARDGASMRSTSSMEERLASDEKLRKEFEEFVKKQKELEKEQKREKKKRKKEKKKTEEVKVTNIFDGMEQNFDVQTTSNSSGRFSD